MEKIRAHLWIDGKVQAVGYRAATLEKASQLGLTGWVRNLSNGQVEAVLEGDEEAVERAIAWCHQGPDLAVVKSVELEYEDPEGLISFALRR